MQPKKTKSAPAKGGRPARSLAGKVAPVASAHRGRVRVDDTRARLLEAALHLFARQGYEGTSIKDLADRAGVNVSLVSYHFGGKEALYRACLEDFARARLEAVQRILTPPESRDEIQLKLRLILDEILSTHVEQPDVCALIHQECSAGLPYAEEIFSQTLLKNFTTMVAFFKGAQARGFVRRDLEPHIITQFLFGAIVHNARMDHIGERYFKRTLKDPKHRAEVVRHFASLIMQGCELPQSSPESSR